ncbi:hypothetical protein HPB50_004949 [Hyalomma asiaticum]|uniref:Uncharacterized protein n=1 Tax=Hyalomma asiaticum TaxID=266040 RepID=A0ACB7RSG6_HYAAI|nr:hypothetical protein HPB50_004949 [Hyalomma asiaticum]
MAGRLPRRPPGRLPRRTQHGGGFPPNSGGRVQDGYAGSSARLQDGVRGQEVNAPNSNTGEGRDGNGSSQSAQDSRSPQSFLPGSDGNGSLESAHGSRNPASSSGRDGDGSSKSAPDSRNTQSLPAGPGSRRPQWTPKPPAHLKDYITD